MLKKGVSGAWGWPRGEDETGLVLRECVRGDGRVISQFTARVLTRVNWLTVLGVLCLPE